MSPAATLEPARALAPLARSPRALAVGLGCWLAIVTAAMAGVWAYKETPGEAGMTPPSWPSESALPRTAGRPLLVLFALPVCPCTRATLTELNELLQPASGRVDVHVVFAFPEGAGDEWRDASSLDLARSIPGASVRQDPQVYEARLFQAKTSGHVVYYDGEGRLRFSGGITGSRGHQGGNPGADAIRALIRCEPPAVASWPVFGCPLAESTEGDGT